MKKILILSILCLSAIMTYAFKIDGDNNKVTSAPVLVLYPMHEECHFATWNYFEQTLNTTARCIETGDKGTWLVNKVYDINTNGEELCNKLHADDTFKNGNFSIVAFSYGGMMARYVIEYCHFPEPVRNLVTFGAPLNGISAISHYTREGFLGSVVDWIVDKFISWDLMDRVIQGADYWRNPTDYDSFLTNSRFLAEANNECHFNQTRKDMWLRLNNAMFIKWEDDQTIIPSESSWWGQYDEDLEVETRHQTRIWNEDLLGMRTLEMNSRVQYTTFPGDHMVFNYTQINDYVLPVLRR